MRAKTDSTHTQTLDKITAEQNKVAQQMETARQALAAASAKADEESHRERMEFWKTGLEEQTRVMEEAVQSQQVTREQADAYLLEMQRQAHEVQLAELRDYYESLETTGNLGEEARRKAMAKTMGEIRAMQSQLLTDTGKWTELVRGLSENADSPAGIEAAWRRRAEALRSQYDAVIDIARRQGEDTVALEEEKNRRLEVLEYERRERMWQLRDQNTLSWSDQYARELDALKAMHAKGIASERQYQARRLRLQTNTSKQYFDFYSGLATSMFSAVQEAEISASEAKYDALIRQAQNNGEDTAALEEEKENRKLEIQKKYADVNFAIKVSQIIADTAVSIMKAFSELGPIGGAVAAALLTATGIAQVAVANAERQKVKSMQPSATAATAQTASTAKAERKLTGYADGGYTGPGDRYEVAGVVHRGEYVVPKPIMGIPRVVDAVGTIEAIRLNRMAGVPSRAASTSGYADGGYTPASPATAAAGESELVRTARELREALGCIRAYVVYRDITRAGETLERASAPFTRTNANRK